MAARSGRPLTVSDVVPARASDTQALSSWFLILSVLIPSLAAGSTHDDHTAEHFQDEMMQLNASMQPQLETLLTHLRYRALVSIYCF